MNVLTGTPLLPTYARFPVTFVDGEGTWLIADDGQRYLDLVAGIAVVSLGHCHPGAARGRARAARAALARLEPLLDRADGEAGAGALGALRRRAGVLLQLGHRGGRGGDQVGAQVDRASSGLVALEGSFHGRTMGALSITGPAGEARAVRAARARRPLRDTRRRSPTPSGPRRPRSCSSRCRARAASARSPPRRSRRRARSPTSSSALLVFDEVQTGHRPHGRVLRLAALRRAAGRGHAREGARERPPDRRAARRRRRADRVRPGRPRLDLRRQPGLLRRRLRRRRGDRRRAARPRPRDRRALRGRSFPDVRGAGLLLAVELGRPAGPVAHAALEHNLLVGTAGETALRLTPPLTISTEEADLGVDLLRETLAMTTKLERQGAILRLVEQQPPLDAGRARRGAAGRGDRRRADDRLARRRPARARQGAKRRRPPRSTRCRAPPTCAGSSSSPPRCATGPAR